jgi:hypothetical protein
MKAQTRLQTRSRIGVNDIYDALRGWEDNMDLACSVNLADAFADLCDDLVKEHLAKGK